jgi:hypothetical protein
VAPVFVGRSVGVLNCCRSSPAQIFLISRSVGTHDYIFLSKTSCVLKCGLIFDERRGPTTTGHYNSTGDWLERALTAVQSPFHVHFIGNSLWQTLILAQQPSDRAHMAREADGEIVTPDLPVKPRSFWRQDTGIRSLVIILTNIITHAHYIHRGLHVLGTNKRPSVLVMLKTFKQDKLLFQTAWYTHLFHSGSHEAIKKGKVVPVLNYLSTTPWRRMGEWLYKSTFSWPRH